MYKIAMPKIIGVPTYNAEDILADLKLCGATRVFLALPPFEYNSEKTEEIFGILKNEIAFFKSHGIETGVWFWAFMLYGDAPFTHIKGFDGKESSSEMCPSDPDFIEYASRNIKRVAEMSPDLIMFDDDLRLGFLDSGFGCFCHHHLSRMSKILDEDVDFDTAHEKCFEGVKNKYRTAYLKSAGDSLRDFCRKMRQAVDSVNPAIRLGACSCMTVWDADGVDSYELAKILAGNTKPFVRLIGAAYWGAIKAWGNRIENVIELERMERSWYDGNDIEIFSEGDVYPRPRTLVPASYLEIFDTALRASGSFDGILKYMFDYTSGNAYERGYIDRHLDNTEIYGEIARIFDGKNAVGVRVYEAKNKIEEADFSQIPDKANQAQMIFFSHSSRFLSEITVPTVYEGTGCAGIAFGENARHLPEYAFSKPLILDVLATKILTEKGIDVGVEIDGNTENVTVGEEVFADGEHISLSDSGLAAKICAKANAEVLSEYICGNERIPAVIRYRNADGNRFLIFNFIPEKSGLMIRGNYRRAMQIAETVEAFGEKMPIKCFGNNNLYTICKTDGKKTAIGLWNCREDYCRKTVIELESDIKNAEFIGCVGRADGNKITIDKINAFEFCFVSVEK